MIHTEICGPGCTNINNIFPKENPAGTPLKGNSDGLGIRGLDPERGEGAEDRERTMDWERRRPNAAPTIKC
jgi:hypothetical protein